MGCLFSKKSALPEIHSEVSNNRCPSSCCENINEKCNCDLICCMIVKGKVTPPSKTRAIT